ncbi:large exoprotein [Microbacterium dauci]|uniref:Large exoprotein n=1 Tax=Microbacterium dauci TaxID=3048008 RepID=A0ABT6ZAI0_9MICO|nr:large exoprotein [Microbacterium sp. LX3-4]MDJ1113167.1 large exoprotein [Microbacterium sp. LX3-4]
MGEQVFGGGVVVLVAVLLWLVYLLPSWHGRHQYEAAERNAVRLNQALRVLAQTSETPDEVRLELNARTALAQQRLARRVQAEQESVGLEAARAELAAAKAQAALDRDLARAERRSAAETAAAAAQQARAEAAAAQSRARAEAAVARERVLAEAAAAKAAPAARRARARRRVRFVATIVAFASLAAAGWGVYLAVTAVSWTVLVAASVVFVASLAMLGQMRAVARRAAVATVAEPVVRVARDVQDVELVAEEIGWMPRSLPQPLTAAAGSRAAAVLDGAAAREALRRAGVEEAMRERVAQAAPPSIDTARRTRTAETAFSGPASDENIEAHVRRLLERRAVGE